MPAPKPSETNPLSLLHEWFARSEKAWSEGLVAALSDQRASPELTRQVQVAVHLQAMASEKVAQYLAAVNLPSRSDVQRLEEQVRELGDGIARIEAELHALRGRSGPIGGDAAPVPSGLRRTRKPKAR